MKKPLVTIIFSLILATLTSVILISYFLVPKEDTKLAQEKEAAFQKYIKERIVKRSAEKIAYLTGHFEPAQRKDFIDVPVKYSIAGYKTYLRKETLTAFTKMAEAASKDNVTLKIASATRNFNYQKNLWNNKWTGVTLVDGRKLPESTPDGLERFKKILEYSAVPGASRHHWGTDIDINGASPEYFETETGAKVYAWLAQNAPQYGFCQPYNQKGVDRPTGYNEEKWHWSYLPLAKTFTQSYKNLITETNIQGFLGDEYVKQTDLIQNYVLGINKNCI